MFILSGLFSSMYVIYVLAAVLPALVLLISVYRKDKVEKEPVGLIISLVIAGAAAAIFSVFLEEIGETLLSSFVNPRRPLYVVLLAFLVVACAEEGTKFLALKLRTWRNPQFNYRFDGIVYSVAVSLGFAALENIGYVFNYGLAVAPTRAIFAIPGHLSFAVFMGYFYGRAKLWAQRGDEGMKKFNMNCAYISAVFFHGFYDACAMTQAAAANVLFLGFVLIMFITVFVTIRREAKHDMPV